MSNEDSREIILKGINASPGICIGKAYLVDREGVNVVKRYRIEKANLSKEINRFKTAVQQAVDELRGIIENTPEDFKANAAILETHVVLMKDKMLYGRTIETIEQELVNAEWALRKVVFKVKEMFRGMADTYFKEREADIVHVSDRIMRNLIGQEHIDIGSIDKRVILVAKDLSPAQTSQIQLERIKGFITQKGGSASHTGIIARTLQIPAVLGVKRATRLINTDDIIIVDGREGKVIVHPTEQTLFRYEERKNGYETFQANVARGGKQPARTTDGLRVHVMGNIELPEEVVSVIDYGGEGIGLYRTEFQYLSRPTFPREEELFEKYRDVVEVIGDMPVTIRTLDINGDKAVVGGTNGCEEANPALGLRAIRYCLKKPEVFLAQLRAILMASAYGKVRILFPMISNLNEVRQAKKYLREAAETLDSKGIAYDKNIQVGIMIEVPAAVIMADVLADEVDFFSIGTNDLIQYTIAIDRGNSEVAHLYHPLHPAILRMLKTVSDVSARKGIKVFMCGEMASDPIHIPILLGLGIEELSMNPQSIPMVKRMIRSVSKAQSEAFTKEALKAVETGEVSQLLERTYGHLLSPESSDADDSRSAQPA